MSITHFKNQRKESQQNNQCSCLSATCLSLLFVGIPISFFVRRLEHLLEKIMRRILILLYLYSLPSFAVSLCQLGFIYACPKINCFESPLFQLPKKNDPCIDWLRFNDCKACEYYRCKEKQYRCGKKGYLLGYVGKYCDRFSTITSSRTSSKAKSWLNKVRECLINEFERSTDDSMSCSEIYKIGTDSHSRCYINSGFCDLSIKDWFDIVHTIDPGDLPFRQLLLTGNSCLKKWLN